MQRKVRTFQCPKCGEVCTHRLASAVGHPCPKQNRQVVEFKEIEVSHDDR